MIVRPITVGPKLKILLAILFSSFFPWRSETEVTNCVLHVFYRLTSRQVVALYDVRLTISNLTCTANGRRSCVIHVARFNQSLKRVTEREKPKKYNKEKEIKKGCLVFFFFNSTNSMLRDVCHIEYMNIYKKKKKKKIEFKERNKQS